jgi:hypothetical protein
VSQELDLDMTVHLKPELQGKQVSEAELSLLSSILPELFKAMAIELELNKE